MIAIRREAPGDEAAVRRVNQLAFGQPDEAELVDALRAHDGVVLSLVAVDDGEIVGHVLFSPVTVDAKEERYTAVGLAPVAVAPHRQRQGIGSRLIREGLAQLAGEGHQAVVLVGHPTYYPRFGFAPASRFGLKWELAVPDEVFMALELQPGALAARGGVVRYRLEFASV